MLLTPLCDFFFWRGGGGVKGGGLGFRKLGFRDHPYQPFWGLGFRN